MSKQIDFYHGKVFLGTVTVEALTDPAVADIRNRKAAQLGVDPSAITVKETLQYDADKAKRKGLS